MSDLLFVTNVVLEDTPYRTEIHHLLIEDSEYIRIVQQSADPDRPDDVVVLPIGCIARIQNIRKGH